jgi:hypothetical protein
MRGNARHRESGHPPSWCLRWLRPTASVGCCEEAWQFACGIACHCRLSTHTRGYGGGAPAKGVSSSATARIYLTTPSQNRQAHLRRRASSPQHAQGLARSEQPQGQSHVLCHRTTCPTVSTFAQKRIPPGTLCTEPHLHPSRLDHPWQCWDKTRASRHKPGYQNSRRSKAAPLSPSLRTHQRQGP